MSWHATDDKFPSHRKVLQARRSPYFAQAVALWLLAGCWCSSQEQERFTGYVPKDVLPTLGIIQWRRATDLLVEVGLWEFINDGRQAGVVFHDWADWNGIDGKEWRTKEQARLRQQAYRRRKCEAGQHDRHCPADTCPVSIKRAARKASREAGNAGSRDPGSGRDGSGEVQVQDKRAEENEHAHASNEDAEVYRPKFGEQP